MEKLLVLLRHLWGQGCKILLAQTYHQKGPGNGIVHLPVLVPQGTVQGQPHELSVIVIDDSNRVISKGVACADGASHSLLQIFEFCADADVSGMLIGLHEKNVQHLLFRKFVLTGRFEIDPHIILIGEDVISIAPSTVNHTLRFFLRSGFYGHGALKGLRDLHFKFLHGHPPARHGRRSAEPPRRSRKWHLLQKMRNR